MISCAGIIAAALAKQKGDTLRFASKGSCGRGFRTKQNKKDGETILTAEGYIFSSFSDKGSLALEAKKNQNCFSEGAQ